MKYLWLYKHAPWLLFMPRQHAIVTVYADVLANEQIRVRRTVEIRHTLFPTWFGRILGLKPMSHTYTGRARQWAMESGFPVEDIGLLTSLERAWLDATVERQPELTRIGFDVTARSK